MKKNLNTMNRVLINWFCTVLSLLGLMICLLLGLMPLAIIMFLLFAGCGLWMSDIMAKEERRRRARRASHDEPEDDICIDIPLDDIEQPESREIRPGSRQSKTYLKMLQGGGCVSANR